MRSLFLLLRQRVRAGLRLSRSEQGLLILATLGTVILGPAQPAAACSWDDVECMGQSFGYPLYLGVASLIWTIDRMLLLLTYQLEHLRAWLIDVVFTSVYATLTAMITPAIAPFATVAVLIGMLAFLAMPLFGKLEIVNVRRALVWVVVAPLLLTISGGWLGQIETFRTNVGGVLFNAAAGAAPGEIFGAHAGDMPSTPTLLYAAPSAACGTPISRAFPQMAGGAPVPQMDDLAATMLYADAIDIHCPQSRASQPGRGTLPLGFYGTPQPNYAVDGDIGEFDDAKRAEAIYNIQAGINRLLLGIIPCILAVCFALIQLVFSFSLVAIWVSLPIGLLFVFFNDTAGGVTGMFRRVVGVLQASWSASLLMGIVFAALIAVSQTGSASAYAGLSIGGILMSLYVMKSAVETLLTSMQTISASLGAATGLTGGGSFAKAAVGGMVGGAAAAAAATMSTSRDMATTGFAAYQGSKGDDGKGNRRYAAAAALSRIQPLARAGEVAALMGVSNEWTEGMYAAKLAGKSKDPGTAWRKMRDLSAKDQAKGRGNNIPTFAERARDRALQRDIQRLTPRENPVSAARNQWRALGRGLNRAGDAVEGALQDPRAAARVLTKPLGPARRNLAALRADAQSPATPGGTGRAAVRALARGSFRNPALGGLELSGNDGDKHRSLTTTERVADAQIPLEAVTERGTTAQQAAWLRRGQRLQRNHDGTWTHWDKSLPLRAISAAADDADDSDALDGDMTGVPLEDTGALRDARPTARAAGVIRRARVAQAASALDRPARGRHTSGRRQRPRPLSATDRAQQAAITAELTAERARAAERERQAAQAERARAVRQRGHENGRRHLQTRAAQRPGPTVPRVGPARGWKRQLNAHLPDTAEHTQSDD